MTIEVPRPSDVLARSYPEVCVSGFPHDDVEIAFSLQVRALIRPDLHVLDFGAGRGEWFEDDRSAVRRDLQLLKGRCAKVVACDVDPAVTTNRAVDEAVVISPDDRLPFDDATFDVIVSRYVLEHVADAQQTAAELMRVLKPGGWFCALTPNKWGYPGIAARVLPNHLHATAVQRVQPNGRAARDVFPTLYRMNDSRTLHRLFGSQADLFLQRVSGPPAYYFGNALLFRIFKMVHALQPRVLSTALMIFARKRH